MVHNFSNIGMILITCFFCVLYKAMLSLTSYNSSFSYIYIFIVRVVLNRISIRKKDAEENERGGGENLVLLIFPNYSERIYSFLLSSLTPTAINTSNTSKTSTNLTVRTMTEYTHLSI